MSLKTENKEVKETKKIVRLKHCTSAKEKGDDTSYHVCKYKENHEGQHRCCACPTTW